MKTEQRASWWKLHILMVVILAALFLITTADISAVMRKFLEVSVIVLGYILVGLWVYSNAAVLEVEARRRQILSHQRRPWHPYWWRSGLNRQQYHYLLVKYGVVKPPRKESAR